MGHPPLLSKPIDGEKLYLYLTVSKEIVSPALVREEEKVQWPVYYVSKRLLDTETRYPELEKLTLALVIASKKLRPYFHAHSIEVLKNYPIAPNNPQAQSFRKAAQVGDRVGAVECELSAPHGDQVIGPRRLHHRVYLLRYN